MSIYLAEKYKELAQREFENYKFKDPRPFGVLPSGAILKLFEGFAIDCTDEEACLYANVSKNDFLRHIATAEGGEFIEHVKNLRNAPVLIARETLVNDLGNIETAKWHIERKRPEEFNLKTLVDVTSKGERLTMASLLEYVKEGQK